MAGAGKVATVVDVDERGESVPGTQASASIRRRDSHRREPKGSSTASSPEMDKAQLSRIESSSSTRPKDDDERGRVSRRASMSKPHRSASKVASSKEKRSSKTIEPEERPPAKTSKSDTSSPAYYGRDIVQQSGRPPLQRPKSAMNTHPTSGTARQEKRVSNKYGPPAPSTNFVPSPLGYATPLTQLPYVPTAPPGSYFPSPKGPMIQPQSRQPRRELSDRFGPEQSMKNVTVEDNEDFYRSQGVSPAPQLAHLHRPLTHRPVSWYGTSPASEYSLAEQARPSGPPRLKPILKQSYNNPAESLADYEDDSSYFRSAYREVPLAPAPPQPRSDRRSVRYESNVSNPRRGGIYYRDPADAANEYINELSRGALNSESLRALQGSADPSSRGTRSTRTSGERRSKTTGTTYSTMDDGLTVTLRGGAILNYNGQQIELTGDPQQEMQVRIGASGGTVRGSQASSVYYGERRSGLRRGEEVDYLKHEPRRERREREAQRVQEDSRPPRRRDSVTAGIPQRRTSSARPVQRVTEYFE